MKKVSIKLTVAVLAFLTGFAASAASHYLQGAYQIWQRNHYVKAYEVSPCDFPAREIDKTKPSCPVAIIVSCSSYQKVNPNKSSF